MQKVAHYRRAIWTGREYSVEALMRNKLLGAPTVVETKFSYTPEITAQIAVRATTGRGLGLYFTLFSEGSDTGTVENGGSRIGRASPPPGTEFLRTGIHMVLEGNHMAYVSNGATNDGQISRLLIAFLESKGTAREQTQFLFMARPNRREIERLLRVGVKSIDLGISSFLATAEELSEAHTANNISRQAGQFVQAVRGLFGPRRTPAEIEAASDIQARLHIGFDGRSASPLLPNVLSGLARQINDGADDFKIITVHDVIITRDKLIIKRDVRVEGDEIALDTDSTFPVLRECLQTWRRDGIMDE